MAKQKLVHKAEVLKELEHLVDHIVDLRYSVEVLREERDRALANEDRNPSRPGGDMGQ